MKNSMNLLPKYLISMVLILFGGVFWFANELGTVTAGDGTVVDLPPMFFVALLGGGLIMFIVTTVSAIAGMFKGFKYKQLKRDPEAYTTTAIFKDARYERTIRKIVNDKYIEAEHEYFTVVYDYTDETGFRHENVESNICLVPKQLEYLKAKGSFQIKCKGFLSVIVEELPEANEDYNVVEEGSNLIESTGKGLDGIGETSSFNREIARSVAESVGAFEEYGITNEKVIENICDDIVEIFNKTNRTWEDLRDSVIKAFRNNSHTISKAMASNYADGYFSE